MAYYYLHDTRSNDVIHIVQWFSYQLHCILHVHIGGRATVILMDDSLPFDTLDVPFGGVDVIGGEDRALVHFQIQLILVVGPCGENKGARLFVEWEAIG